MMTNIGLSLLAHVLCAIRGPNPLSSSFLLLHAYLKRLLDNTVAKDDPSAYTFVLCQWILPMLPMSLTEAVHNLHVTLPAAVKQS